jgi:hypothetical protein
MLQPIAYTSHRLNSLGPHGHGHNGPYKSGSPVKRLPPRAAGKGKRVTFDKEGSVPVRSLWCVVLCVSRSAKFLSVCSLCVSSFPPSIPFACVVVAVVVAAAVGVWCLRRQWCACWWECGVCFLSFTWQGTHGSDASIRRTRTPPEQKDTHAATPRQAATRHRKLVYLEESRVRTFQCWHGEGS